MYLWLVYHFQPGPFSTEELYISSILVPYHPIPVSRCASQLNPGPISTQSRSRDGCLTSIHAPAHLLSVSYSCTLLHPHRVSPPPRSWYLHPISIHVVSHLQVARCETCSSALSMFHPWINLLIILYSSCTWFFSALHTDAQNHYAYIMCGSVKEVWQET